MNRNYIFVFILLAILNVNSHPLHKRTTTFIPCLNAASLNIVISPDPLVSGQDATYTISGKLDVEIPDDHTTLNIVINGGLASTVVDFCSIPGIKCPVPPGTEIN